MKLFSLATAIFVSSVSYANCPDVSGKFVGQCTESNGRIALYRFNIKQINCDSVTVEPIFFKDTFNVNRGVSAPKFGEEGAYTVNAGTFSKTEFISTVIVVNKNGTSYTEVTSYSKIDKDGVKHLNFIQKLYGTGLEVNCLLPEVP